MKERTKLLLIVGVFVAAYYVPWGHPLIRQSGLEAFMMLQARSGPHPGVAEERDQPNVGKSRIHYALLYG